MEVGGCPWRRHQHKKPKNIGMRLGAPSNPTMRVGGRACGASHDVGRGAAGLNSIETLLIMRLKGRDKTWKRNVCPGHFVVNSEAQCFRAQC